MARAWALLFLAAWATQAACSRRSSRTPDDTLVYLFEASVKGIDPRYVNTALDLKVSRLVAPGLVSLDEPDLLPRPELAESIEPIDDVTWVATLRADARFSDGTPVRASDVVYTFRSTMDPKYESYLMGQYAERIASVEALDPRRVRFRLKAPLATFLTDLDLGILSEAAMEAAGGRFADGGCVGAGPYRLVSLSDAQVLLERNEHYYGAPPPTPKLLFKTIGDQNARVLLMAGGSADVTQNTLRVDLIPYVAESPRLQVLRGPSAVLTYLMFNNEDPVLKDPRVRRALAHAVDRRAIVDAQFAGYAELATGLLPPGHWAYNPDVDAMDFDPAKARRLLDEAGYPDPDGDGPRPRFRLTYKTSSDSFRLQVARLIAQQLGQVGVEVEVRAFEFHVFFTDIKRGAYQLASMQTGAIIEPDMYWFYFHSERIPTPDKLHLANRWRYRNPEVDRLIEEGRRTLDREARKAVYGRLQAIMARDLPIFPLWHEDNVAVLNVELEGFQVIPSARLSSLASTRKAR